MKQFDIRKRIRSLYRLLATGVVLTALITCIFPSAPPTTVAAEIDLPAQFSDNPSDLQVSDYINADAIVIGTILDKTSYWDTGKNGIYTSVVLAVDETLKGSVNNKNITVTYAGGQAYDTGEWVSDMPSFSISEKTAVLLNSLPPESAPEPQNPGMGMPEEQFTVYGGYKGKFTIVDDTIGGLPLDEFREIVRRIAKNEAFPGQKTEVVLSEAAEAVAPPVTLPYLYTGEHWANPPGPVINYRINENTSDCFSEGTAVQTAAATWNAAGAKVSFNYSGASLAASYSSNGLNEILWRSLSPGTLAVTHIWYYVPSLIIYECDMEFNDNYLWSADPVTPPGYFDIESIALHEFGHFFMLKDLYNYETDRFKAMYGIGSPGAMKRSLHPDDISGVRAIYGMMVAAPAISTIAAGGITQDSARLNGELTSTGGEDCSVHIYWGPYDGGTDPANWANDTDPGIISTGIFYADIGGLSAATTYYFRCYAVNSGGETWAATTGSFTTITALTMAVSGNGTTAPETGTHLFNTGDIISISAFSSPNWEFRDWTGDTADDGLATTNVTMTGNKTVTANFERISGTLTLNSAGSGTITPVAGDYTYPVGAIVDIGAEPASGWRFARWIGDTASVDNVTSPDTSVIINGDYHITALFDQPVLTIATTGAGSVTPGTGTHAYSLGSDVTLSAAPAPNWAFLNWSGDVWESQSTTTNVTIATDKTVTANFVRTHGTLTLTALGGGATNPQTGVYTYEVGTPVSISAAPAEGWQFVYWSGDISTIGNASSNNITLTIDGDYTITANFTVIGGVGIGGGGGFIGGGGGAVATNDKTITSFGGLASYEGVVFGEIKAESADARAMLEIPKGTKALNRIGNGLTSITILKVNEPDQPPEGASIIGEVYEFGPQGATFDPPITLTIKYSEEDLPAGITEDMLCIAYRDKETGLYTPTEFRIDKEKNEIYAPVSHFSRYTVFANPKPPEFALSGLSINPLNPELGENVDISVTVANTGDLNGIYTCNLLISGLDFATQEADIQGGGQKTLHFSGPANGYGTFCVSIGNLEGSYTIEPPSPASFKAGVLSVPKDTVEIGEDVKISLIVTNTGETEGDYIVVLKADSAVIGTKEITVPGGADREVVLITSFDTPGEKAIDVNGLTGTVKVKEKLLPPPETIPPTANQPAGTIQSPRTIPDTPDGANVPLIIGVTTGFLAVAGCLFLFVRRQKRPGKRPLK